jgi:dihydrodipicolinate synthase/N-acetylneuraminate lyase
LDKPAGIIPALCTLTDARGNLDEKSERSLVRSNIEWGSSALAVSIVAGEFYKFTDAERVRSFEIVADEANGKVPIWAGVAHLGTEPSIELARKAKSIGVDGIIAQAGLVGKDASSATFEHFDTIMSRLDLPVMIQDAEDFNGIRIDPNVYVKLSDSHSNFVSVKIEGGKTLEKIREAKSMVGKRLSILGGMGGRLILDELALGTDGSIPNSCLTDLVVDTFRKNKAGLTDDAGNSFLRYKPWLDFQTKYSLSGSEIVKETLRLRGVVESSSTRSPHVPLSEEAKTELAHLLQRIGIN